MDYFIISVGGVPGDSNLCIVDDPPEGMGLYDYCLIRGERAASHFPKDAKVFLRKERTGIRLAGILGNTHGFFIGSVEVKKVIEELCPNREIEYLPFILYNQKGRVHSKDYFFINPIGGFDCLNEKASGATYDSDGEIITVKKFVLDPMKLTNAPDFFRIHKVPTEYVVSQRFVDAFHERGIKNLAGRKLLIK